MASVLCHHNKRSAGAVSRECNTDLRYHEDHRERSVHIHFGAGRLGLGLVLPILRDLGLTIVTIQRPGSPDWAHLQPDKEVSFYVNSDHMITFTFVTDTFTGNVTKLLQHGKHLLISVNNPEIIIPVLQSATSLSTSVGPTNLSSVLETLRLIPSYQPHTKLFAFENDFHAVHSFGEKLRQEIKHIQTVPVMSDRICTDRKIQGDNNQITVVTEEYLGSAVVFSSSFNECVPFKHNGLPVTSEPNFAGENSLKKRVIVANTPREETFYYQRKFSLLNGIHFTMAVYAYDIMRQENKEEPSNWGQAPLSVYTRQSQHSEKIMRMIEARIFRLLVETDAATLQGIFQPSNFRHIFQELLQYAHGILQRIAKTHDTVGRILNFGDREKVQSKFSQHLCELETFLMTQQPAIQQLGLLERPVDEYCWAVRDLKKKFIQTASIFGIQFPVGSK